MKEFANLEKMRRRGDRENILMNIISKAISNSPEFYKNVTFPEWHVADTNMSYCSMLAPIFPK